VSADLHVAPDLEAASRLAAARVAEIVAEAVDLRGQAHLALAGGTTPRRTYELLAERIGDWSRVGVWFGDERAVPPDDPESNFRMVTEALGLGHELGPELIHRVEGERGAAEAARRYGESLDAVIPAADAGVPVLDLAFQGLGPDGHTASLFPNHPALDAGGICVAVHDAPKPPPDRVSLTLPVLRAARRIMFLIGGEEKAAAMEAMLAGADPATPASLLVGPRTTLIADEAAAVRLDRAPR
jgi:6-phosphogluconolactonase